MPTPSSPLDLATAALALFDMPRPSSAEFVSGGLSHRLLRVETSAGAFALKLLAPRSTENEASRARLECAETVATLAKKGGVPALTAHPGPGGRFLQQVGHQWVALYSWQEGHTLPPTAASVEECRLMGAHLARLHALEIRFSNQTAPVPEAFPSGHFRRIEERAKNENAYWAPRLTEAFEALEAINALAMQSQLQLQTGWVTGHLDCDQKNVLWHGGAPVILDWESAKPIHPALEAMGAGLSWAGQSAGDAQFESFAAFFNGYQAVYPLSPTDLDLAVDAVLGKWIIWLEFNLQRLLEPDVRGTDEERIAFDAGMHALGATLALHGDAGKYQSWLQQLTENEMGS